MSSEEKSGNSGLLANYRALVGKVDTLCRDIVAASGDAIACRKGCDGCCRQFSVFPVEAYSIARAVSLLDPNCGGAIRERAMGRRDGDECPLLDGGCCLLYEHRPIICRTHGLPILMRSGEAATVDFCPRNYRNADSLDGRNIIDLDRLNDTLSAINSIFMKEIPGDGLLSPGRLTIAEAILLDI